jgi:CheY-like chemotaxis protein
MWDETVIGFPVAKSMDDSFLSSHSGWQSASMSEVHPPVLPANRKPPVLIVDDDEDSLVLMAYALEPFGYRTIAVTDGWSALQKAQTDLPALILLDILLPDMDGMEAIAQFKQNPRTKDIPIIAVTALADVAIRQRLLQIGCSGYISKPYLLEDLEALVSPYLPAPAATS